VCLAAGLAPVVRAADPVEQFRVNEATSWIEHVARLQAAVKKAELTKALAKVVDIHNKLRTNAVRGKLQKAIGDLIKDESLGAVRMSAADTLGRLNDPKGAWKQLKRFLPAVGDAAVGPLPLRVAQAVGSVAPDAAILPLVKLMEKAKDMNVSRYAIQALGKFGWSKQRTKVLRSLGGFLARLRPGVSTSKTRGGGQAARRRYDFLRVTLGGALNELTGQKIDGADKWLATWKANKKKPSKLFTFER